MMGAPNGFGAGGWTNTPIEQAMPVDFQIKAAKIIPRGALVMMMHASEMAQGNFWQKKIAEEAMKALGPRDYCGVIHYDNQAATKWLWKPGMATVGAQSQHHAGADQQDDARRHAPIQSGHGSCPARVCQSERCGREAHDRDQRWRPNCAEQGIGQIDERSERDRFDGRRRHPRPGRERDPEGLGQGHGRKVLCGQKPQGSAQDLPTRGASCCPATDLREFGGCPPRDPLPP